MGKIVTEAYVVKDRKNKYLQNLVFWVWSLVGDNIPEELVVLTFIKEFYLEDGSIGFFWKVNTRLPGYTVIAQNIKTFIFYRQDNLRSPISNILIFHCLKQTPLKYDITVQSDVSNVLVQ
jgi:hypothetical protein